MRKAVPVSPHKKTAASAEVKKAAASAKVVPPPTGQQRRMISKSPAEITAAAKLTTASSSGWGISFAEAQAGGVTKYVQIDSLSGLKATYLVQTLGDAPPILIERSGVTLQRVKGTLDKLRPTMAYYGNALAVQLDVESSLAVMGTVSRKLRDDLTSKILPLIPEGVLLQPWQQRLLAIWRPVMALQAKQIQQTATKVDLGKRRAKQRTADLAAAGDHVELLKTILDAKAGKQVDPEKAAEAVAQFNAQKQGDLGQVAQALGNTRRQGR